MGENSQNNNQSDEVSCDLTELAKMFNEAFLPNLNLLVNQFAEEKKLKDIVLFKVILSLVYEPREEDLTFEDLKGRYHIQLQPIMQQDLETQGNLQIEENNEKNTSENS